MRLMIFMTITFLFPTVVRAACQDTDIVGAVDYVETGTTTPVMITPISEISTYEITKGFKILANSEIVTDASSRVRIVFVDGTSVMIEANSRIKIDKFIFSCDSSRITEQTMKGFLRAISGQLKSQQPPTLRGFSSAGIRG